MGDDVKAWIAAIVALIALLLVYPLLFPSVVGLSESQAKQIVLDDIKPLLNQGLEARIVHAEKKEKQWQVDVLITKRAHSICPFVEKRFYTLLPIGFRSENVVDSCNEKVDINYREEALIQSAKLVDVGGQSAYGCAFFGKEYLKPEAKLYCQDLNDEGINAFAQNLPDEVWVTQWTPSNRFVALSKNGQLLKSV